MAAQDNAQGSSGDQGKFLAAKVATVDQRRASRRLLPPPSYAAKFSADFWRPVAGRKHGGDFDDTTLIGFSAQLFAHQRRYPSASKRQISKPEAEVPECSRDAVKMVSRVQATLRKGTAQGGGDADQCRRSKIPCPLWYFANNSSVESTACKSPVEPTSVKSRKLTGFSRTSDSTVASSSASSSPPKTRGRKNTPTSQVRGPMDHGFVNGRRSTKVLSLEPVKCRASKPAACSRPMQHHEKCAASCIKSSAAVPSSLPRVRVQKEASTLKIHGPPHHGIAGHQRAAKKCSATGNSAASDNSAVCHHLTRFYDKCNASRVPSSTSHMRGAASSSSPKTRGRNDTSRVISSSGSVQVVVVRQPSQESVMMCEHLDVISGDNELDKFPTLATLEDLSPSDDDFDRSSTSVDGQLTQEHHVHVHDDDESETKTSPVSSDDVTRLIGDVERPSVYEETITSLSREMEQPSAIDEGNEAAPRVKTDFNRENIFIEELNVIEPLLAGSAEITPEHCDEEQEATADVSLETISRRLPDLIPDLPTFVTMGTMPLDSDRQSVAQEQQTKVSFQMLKDESALHLSIRPSSSSTEQPQQRCCDGDNDDDILNASGKLTLSDRIHALIKKLKTVFTSWWNIVAMKSRSVEQGRETLLMNKDLNQIDLRSYVNEWTEDEVMRTESPSAVCSHLSSSSSDESETFVQNRFIDSEPMSSASGDDWSDNDFEEADEPDVGDMLPTMTEINANTQECVIDCLDLSSSTMTSPGFHGSSPKKMAMIEAAVKSVVDTAFGDSEECE